MEHSEPVGRLVLTPDERHYFRHRFRQARYEALKDLEGFHIVCYALEELGITLRTEQAALGGYFKYVQAFVNANMNNSRVGGLYFSSAFEPLYRIVQHARNDAMHTGAYARQVTAKALELCLQLEDALMSSNGDARLVGDYMVRQAVCVEPWQPVNHARQLMLAHSFSNLPVRISDRWCLLTEMGMARYLMHSTEGRPQALGRTIEEAAQRLGLVEAKPSCATKADADVATLVTAERGHREGISLWLVLDDADRLLGVISAFELI